MDKCADCGGEIDWLRAVRTTEGSTYHWRCYHARADTLALPGEPARPMTDAEREKHQQWADSQHDGRGNQIAKQNRD